MGDHGDDMFDDDLSWEGATPCDHHPSVLIRIGDSHGCWKCEDGYPDEPAKRRRPPARPAGED